MLSAFSIRILWLHILIYIEEGGKKEGIYVFSYNFLKGVNNLKILNNNILSNIMDNS